MTKREALNQWKTYRLPAILWAEAHQSGRPDRPRRCEDWNNYTDALTRTRRNLEK